MELDKKGCRYGAKKYIEKNTYNDNSPVNRFSSNQKFMYNQ